MNSQRPLFARGVPECFLSKFGSHVSGVLSGFDRLRFRATLRLLFVPAIMEGYLNACHVLLKDFKTYALGVTARFKAAAYASAKAAGRPDLYLPSPEISKEEKARQIAQADGVKEGLIALFSATEPCLSYSVRGDKATRRLRLVLEVRKCTHFYHYFMHPDFGQVSVRVQSWFPFAVDVCLNGREWLARQMDRAGVAYEKRDNCFAWVSDAPRAQELLEEQLRTDWTGFLQPLLEKAHPLHAELGRPLGQSYYWSASQTEFATDVLFKDAAALAGLYPALVHHGIRTFGGEDVLRFFGKTRPECCGGEVKSTRKRRVEGVRLRHEFKGNSIKMYDKQGSVLRVETTIVRPEEFKVYRSSHGAPEQKKDWKPMRRSVADLARRAEVSAAANERYLTALASTAQTIPLKNEASEVCRRRKVEGRSYRALNPWAPEDARLLEAVSRAEFTINGFRNRDLRAALFGKAGSDAEERRRAAKVSRHLGLLKAHGLIAKVGRTHRWKMTEKGRRTVTALLTAREADVEQLTKLAA